MEEPASETPSALAHHPPPLAGRRSWSFQTRSWSAPTRRVWGLTPVPLSATIVVMSIESLREVRDHFSDVVDRVQREHERVTVTRNGKAAAVILSPEDLAELEETVAVLSDPAALADIREADLAYQEGNVVRGADAVRALLR